MRDFHLKKTTVEDALPHAPFQKLVSPQELIQHLIYGDIEEMPLSVLGDDCPTDEEFQKLDAEQRTRLAAAATVWAWAEGRLLLSGDLLGGTGPQDSLDREHTVEDALSLAREVIYGPYLKPTDPVPSVDEAYQALYKFRGSRVGYLYVGGKDPFFESPRETQLHGKTFIGLDRALTILSKEVSELDPK